MKTPALIVSFALAVAGAPLALAAEAATPAAPAATAAPATPEEGKVATPEQAKEVATQTAAVEVPEEVAAEMNKLVQLAIQAASGPLQTGDDFTPYGVVQMNDGKLQMVSWSKPNPPPPIEMFRQIYMALRAEAKKPEVVAAVTVAPTSAPTVDGAMRVNLIRAEVDHRRGAPRIVLIPYTRKDGKLELGTPVYQPGTNPVFDHSKKAEEPAKPAAKGKANAKPAAKATDKPAAKGAKPAAKTP